MTIDVVLQNDGDIDAPSKNDLESWVNGTLDFLSVKDSAIQEITVRIVDKNESAKLNETYRYKVGPTNILSFPYDAIPGETPDSLGDLIICSELVAQEAKEQHKPIHEHWAHLVVHGSLHLLGYDHLTDEEAVEMEALEVAILANMNIDDPYQ